MSNPLYWEDQVSGSNGGRADMIVDTHAPAFSVQWGTGKYDDVEADHTNLVGEISSGVCRVCGKQRVLMLGVCSYCQASQNLDELQRIKQDSPMGSNKRATHILTDTRR